MGGAPAPTPSVRAAGVAHVVVSGAPLFNSELEGNYGCGALLTCEDGRVHVDAKRIRPVDPPCAPGERDRIPVGVPIQVEPSGQSDGLLG